MDYDNLLLDYNYLLLDYNNLLLDYNNLLPDYDNPIIIYYYYNLRININPSCPATSMMTDNLLSLFLLITKTRNLVKCGSNALRLESTP